MKKIVQTLTLACISAIAVNSQVIIPIIDSPEYQNQKQAGTLSLSQPGAPAQIIPGDLFGGGNVQPLSACSCYVEPDATWSTLVACDDCSSGQINLPFNFCLFGSSYSTIYINNNGNISFGAPYGTFSPVVFPNNQFIMVAPFWADVDTRNNLGNVRYKITPTALYVNWVNVGYYNTQGDKRNTFSVILTNNNDASIGVGNNVAFCYKDMQWTTGSASGGSGGFGGTPALVGANWGNGVDYNMIGRFNGPGTTYFGPNATNNQVSWLDFKSFKFNVCNNVNVPPVLISGTFPGYSFQPDTCNAINGGVMTPNPGGAGGICVGQTVSGSLTFTGPENNQNVTVTISGPPGISSTGGTGTTSTLNFSYTPTAGTSGTQTLVITATDNGNPNLSTTVTLMVNVTAPPYYPTISGPDNVCPGGTATQAVNEFFNTYAWSGAGSGNGQSTTGGNGTYNVTVTFGACTLTTSKTVGLFTPPTPVIIGNPQVCAGQTTPLTTAAQYVNYAWSNGDMTAIANAGAGTHTVQVVDANGCQGTSAPFVITEYVAPLIQANPVNVSCNGFSDGQLIVQMGGATGNESIVWDHDPLVTSFTATGLAAGTYTFTVTDANGCTWPGSGTVTEPTPLSFNITTTNVTCPGGADGGAVAMPSGGTAPYSYQWNNNPSNNQQYSTGFSMGTYPVTVTDANGCLLQQSFTLTEISTTPTITSTSVLESCPGAANGTINLTVTGGTPTFTYLWSNSDTNEDPTGLATGNYTVTVTDINGCTFTHTSFVPVGENLTLTQNVNNVLCHGDLTGSITINPITGIPPFTVLMNGAPASLNNNNLGAGNYNFYLTDVNGCYYSFSSVITQPTQLVVDSTFTSLSLGDVTTLNIFASGGVPPYTYNWSPASFLSCTDCTSPLCSAVMTTPYMIQVTDANGCVEYGQAMVEVISSPVFAPASFTPNGDGTNDVFLVSIAGLKTFEMRIYSRWGEKMFESNDIYKGWDGKVNGKLVEGGVYTYKIYARLISGKEIETHGNVTILR